MQSYFKSNDAGIKPRKDAEDILSELGGKNIGLPRIYVPSVNNLFRKIAFKSLDKLSAFFACLRMPNNQCVLIQYPWQEDFVKIYRVAKSKNNKVIVLIHDLIGLRGDKEKDFESIKEADVVITHTQNMSEWLRREYGIDSFVELHFFDYLLPGFKLQERIKPLPWHIVYAGNLKMAPFLEQLNFEPSNVIVDVYGKAISDALLRKSFVKYQGCLQPEEIPTAISKFHFGIVWNGTTADGCNGAVGDYLRYNAPYKISSYIAAGLPLIAWKKMGLSTFIEENGLGITVDSLQEVDTILKRLNISDYERMCNNVLAMRDKLLTGGSLTDAITRAQNLLYS